MSNNYTIFVGNVPLDVDNDAIKDLFERLCGEVEKVNVHVPRSRLQDNQKATSCYAFVQFVQQKGFDRALELRGSSDFRLGNNSLNVNQAKSSSQIFEDVSKGKGKGKIKGKGKEGVFFGGGDSGGFGLGKGGDYGASFYPYAYGPWGYGAPQGCGGSFPSDDGAKSNARVFVTGVPGNIDQAQLCHKFASFGRIVSAIVVFPVSDRGAVSPETKKSWCIAFSSMEEAASAVLKMKGSKAFGGGIRVTWFDEDKRKPFREGLGREQVKERSWMYPPWYCAPPGVGGMEGCMGGYYSPYMNFFNMGNIPGPSSSEEDDDDDDEEEEEEDDDDSGEDENGK
mmetsp:Transcript_84044/g.186576  ORF Transcript_84044/g.186576 Transcript_84044/m.186576 type:complete len:339 (+) Transcript_84044:75-1091(+)